MGGTTGSIATTESVGLPTTDRPVPRRLVSLEGAGHVAFMDLCLIARSQGGVLQLARDWVWNSASFWSCWPPMLVGQQTVHQKRFSRYQPLRDRSLANRVWN